MREICFTRNELALYVTILILLIIFFGFIVHKQNETFTDVNLTMHLDKHELEQKVKQLEEHLFNANIKNQVCERSLHECKQGNARVITEQNRSFINKIQNPLESPDRLYQNPRSNDSSYQMIGYVYNSADRFPLFGRLKYPGRSDKWEYYIIDETRNRIKIPFKTKNDNELYDNDTLDVPTIGSVTVKIYEYESLRYNPDIF